MNIPWLTLLVALPWAGALLLAVLPPGNTMVLRFRALFFSLTTLAIAIPFALKVDFPRGGFAWIEQRPWIEALGVNYTMGIDGMSLLLVLLTGVVAPIVVLASWNESRNQPRYLALVLFLQGSALGVFLALDFFLWFIFWELSLVPAFFLIKSWGGPASSRAAVKFFVFTIAGSAFMLAGFAALYAATGTFDFVALGRMGRTGELASQLATFAAGSPVSPRFFTAAVFVGVLLGLAVKVPLFPFHTWLPDAYAEAPTPVTIFLTAVMSKMGVYGFLRILWPMFPAEIQAAAPVLLVLALLGVVAGAFAALAQRDLKRMLAYSSVNHLSYCLLALFAVASSTGLNRDAIDAALGGAILQMVNHGISAAALFLMIGVLENRSGGLRGIGDFGGVRTAAPVFAGVTGIALFSSLGLPGLNGFVSEFLIFRGVFGLVPWAAAVACLGLLATAVFLLTFYLKVFHGPRREGAPAFADLTGRETLTVAPLILLMFLLGLMPQLAMAFANPVARQLGAWIATP